MGYCRAVRAGSMIHVSGTTPVDKDGAVVAAGDAYGQACRCFEIIEESLRALGGELNQVVRTRMYVSDVALWEEFGRAHKRFFGDHPPASTMVGAKLVNDEFLIEVEAEAYIG